MKRERLLDKITLEELIELRKEGIVIKEYACAGDAEKETGISMANIRMVCRGKRKSAGGYEWHYCPNCGMKADGDSDG